jgi:RHS repeat-associated protein
LTSITHKLGATSLTSHAYALDAVGNVSALQEYVQGISPATGWSPGIRVNDDTGSTQQSAPDVAVAPDDTAHAVWRDARTDSTQDIFYARLAPNSAVWDTNQRVNDVTTDQQGDAHIAVDQNGNAYAVWLDARNGRDDVYFSKRPAATGVWSANTRVNSVTTFSEQRAPSIAVSGSGEAIVVWYRKVGTNKFHIYSARLAAGGSTWSAEIKVTTDTAAAKDRPEVTIGSNGVAYAVWMQPSTTNSDIWFASLPSGGSTWSANSKINDDIGTTHQLDPQIGVDAAGNVLVIWVDWGPTPDQLRARQRAPNGTWSPSVLLAAGAIDKPSLSVAADGRALATWSVGSNNFSSDRDPTTGAWSSPAAVNDTGSTAGSTWGELGTARDVVAWTNGAGASIDIYARTRTGSGGGTEAFSYGYDRLYRLTTVSGPDGSRTYGYDPVGNRASRVLSGTTTLYNYDRADRITSAGSTTITMNAVGATTARGTDTFSYDQANRLKTATVAGATETSAYDGDGVRFSQQVGGGPVIRSVTDPSAGLPVTIDDGTSKYVWGLGLAYAVSGSNIEVQHADRLGSIRAVTNGTGAVIAAFRTDEFGISTHSTGAGGSPFRYTGEPLDVSGLTYLRARSYDPSIGRFMTRDPFAGLRCTPNTLNRFSYVQNNPTTWRDPSGLKAKALSGGQSAGFCGAVQGGSGAGVGGVFLTMNLCLVKDDTGRRSILLTHSTGNGTMLGLGVSATGGYFIANGRIPELLGPFDLYGVSGGPKPYSGGVDVSVGGDIVVFQLAGGLSVALPIEFHAGPTTTLVVIEDSAYLNLPSLAGIWASLDLILAVQSWF